MAYPVFPSISSVRSELLETSRKVASEIGMTHGHLGQCEDFEYVPLLRDYNSYFMFKKFLEHVNQKIAPNSPNKKLLEIFLKYGINKSLENDRLFHAMLPSVLEPTFINTNKTYGPLFTIMLTLYFEEISDSYLLRSTTDDLTNYLLSFVFNRTWGAKALNKRKIGKILKCEYVTLNKHNDYLGQINTHDLRNVFWFSEIYKSKRPIFAYLIFYLLLSSFYVGIFNSSNNPKRIDTSKLKDIQHPLLKKSYCHNTCNTTCSFFVLHAPSNIQDKHITVFLNKESYGSFQGFCVKEGNFLATE